MTSAVTADARKTMKSLYRAPEPDVLKPLLDRAAATPEMRERIMGHASGLLADLRAAQNRGWVNQFLQEYRLNSSEGVALLSLAEAFLRVPDPGRPTSSSPTSWARPTGARIPGVRRRSW
jgi:RHH-type proline utilization regulon transcriptional repressor/proline dehydrogenase/delta 1-pyrroline-5-carboxylate dehydrogenase